MVTSRWKRVGVAVVLLTSAAVGCTRRGSAAAPPDAPPQTEWSLTITNGHWLDVSVYVMYDGQRTHVGLVTAATTQTYVLPPHTIGQGRTVRLHAEAIGSSHRATTEALLVQGGQHVEWTLQSGLERSSVAVW